VVDPQTAEKNPSPPRPDCVEWWWITILGVGGLIVSVDRQAEVQTVVAHAKQ